MTVATYETITLSKATQHEGITILTLNRPESMNALNTKMAIELIEALHELKYEESLSVLVLTGEGTKSFCAGADLKERNGMSHKDWKRQHDYFEEVTTSIRSFPFPVIAAVNGYALGGGLEIALSCDLRTVAAHMQAGLPEAKLGLIPGIGGTQMLSRLLPIGLAKEVLYTGRKITAQEALQWGMVNGVYPAESLMEETLKLAESIASNAPLSLKALKKAINHGSETDLATGLALELEAYYKCADSEDRLEGIRAFNEKREPVWQGK
ncbi:enoyl-CoA hydratase/isomerase family protein [Fictibacillus enclensis]|uniref:enoyl-CoA hydratase/isomerase family protein n=1 Tax=Fictibacillus enclensis TaxID=1017270 RepID=UPI0024C062EF|nr:enoyl-CoA hydratase-related protein [Fictibacillus enclensis]WHY71477.1 enoyl-CoA hydratase-related protein [Fictibacillus enclensis]